MGIGIAGTGGLLCSEIQVSIQATNESTGPGSSLGRVSEYCLLSELTFQLLRRDMASICTQYIRPISLKLQP